jgi:hypothetical protein
MASHARVFLRLSSELPCSGHVRDEYFFASENPETSIKCKRRCLCYELVGCGPLNEKITPIPKYKGWSKSHRRKLIIHRPMQAGLGFVTNSHNYWTDTFIGQSIVVLLHPQNCCKLAGDHQIPWLLLMPHHPPPMESWDFLNSFFSFILHLD